MSERVLTFHGIGVPHDAVAPDEQPVWVPRDWFTAILDAIEGDDQVHVTFDDGNSSDFALALPELHSRGRVATFFVLAGRLDDPRYVGRGEIRELVAAGMAIGSHGYSHRSWRDADDRELHEELVVSRAVLADAAGTSVTAAACPFGAYDRRVLRAAQSAGYSVLCTSDGGPLRQGAWVRPRTTITSTRSLDDWLAWLADDRSHQVGALRRAKTAVKRWR